MQRLRAILGSTVFFVVAPGTVAGFVPWWTTHWHFAPPFLNSEFTRWIGAAIVITGFVPLITAFAQFAWDGLGTPAPIAPPERLVVRGFYRRVRNPMYISVVMILAGEALLFADRQVLVWALVMWAGAHLFVVFCEEPALARQFGERYRVYRENVPRWLPRPKAREGA